jgi:hypothetical protein
MRRLLDILMLLACPALVQANPTDELLRIVPGEATVCFIAQDLRGHAARVTTSPWGEWVGQSAWGRSVGESKDYQRFLAARNKIAETLGLKPDELRDGIFGDAVVYAYLPGPAGKPEDDAGLLLTQARDARLLERTVAKLNESQSRSGEVLKIAQHTHAGAAYFMREKPGSKADFYFIDGGLLLYSSRERPIRLALERRANAEPLAKATPFFAEARKQLGFERAAFAGLFAPRSIDAELKSVAGLLPNDDAKAFVQQFSRFWATVDAVGIALELDAGAEISLGWVSKANRAVEAPRASAIWAAVPDDAILAVAGTIRWNEWLAAARNSIGEASRVRFQQWLDQTAAPIFGREVLPALLERIGPDLGGWIAPPRGDAKSILPTIAFAIRIPPAGSTDAKLRDALRQGIDFVAQAYRVDYNRKHEDQFSWTSEEIAGGRISTLENNRALPSGVRPSYGLREEFLVAGSDPRIVADFPAQPKADAKNAGLIARFSAKQAAKYLRQHGQALAAALATESERDASQMDKEFKQLESLLELFESWELRYDQRRESNRIVWKIEFAKPLKGRVEPQP